MWRLSLKAVYVYSLFLLGTCDEGYGQQQTLIGVNVNSEIYPGAFRPSFGTTVEKQYTRRSGFETGLFYRSEQTRGIIPVTQPSGITVYSFTIGEQHFLVPILYKFYSSFLNFSAGPTFDAYVGWKQKKDALPYPIQSYDVAPKFKVGFLTKVSKVLLLHDRIILEPEIRFGSVQTFNEAGIGIGIAGKYRF